MENSHYLKDAYGTKLLYAWVKLKKKKKTGEWYHRAWLVYSLR